MNYSRLLKVQSPLMYGDDVRAVQTKLNALGYNCGSVDGYFGSKSDSAVRSFQRAKGLSVDGMVGPQTWNKLFTPSSGSGNTGSNTGIVSNEAIDFIKTYEGFYAEPYYCPAGVLTIGYGSTSGWIMKKSHVTKEEATRALKEEVVEKSQAIKKDLNKRGIVLKQCEFDALASFAYNCGTGALLSQSTLYKKICAGVRGTTLKQYFEMWSKADGKTLQGLLNRRRDEFEMFNNGDYKRTH